MIVMSSYVLYLLLLTVHGSFQKSTPTSTTYRAAVVELHSIFYENDSTKTLNHNAEKFVSFIGRAAEKNVDIIVFPELGLTSLDLVDRANLISWSTVVPDPSQNYAPCTNSSISVHESVKKIACATERNDIYVVINLIEKEVCSENDCPSDGIFLYVTSVVFDRKGKIIARYRKGHQLRQDGLFDVMKTQQISIFYTDFGVTFGNIICLDIMYEEPWLTLTRKLNITDIIFPAGWFSEMPFLTSIQMEAGWAYAEDVNMLASGNNKVDWAISGSGIYAGRQGILTAILPSNTHEGLLIADVWKKTNRTMAYPRNNHNDDFKLTNTRNELNQERDSYSFKWFYDQLNTSNTKVIAKEGLTLQKLDHSGLKCRFQVNVTNLDSPVTYRMLVFDGIRLFGNVTALGTRVCAIVQCADDTVTSCGHIRNSSAIFNYIAISAMYVDNSRTVMMPSTLGSDMLPLKNWILKEHRHKKLMSMSITMKTPTQNLVTYGLWGRNFEEDQMSTAYRIFNQLPHLPFLLVLLENVITVY